MLHKYLNPKNDVAFKRIFGTEKNQDILIHFLNDMICFKGKKPIISVTFLPTEQNPVIALKKTSIVDILCKDNKGNQYIVEMQVADSKGFEKRAQYYASKAYISQANVGHLYHNLKEVIFLAISNFVMFPKKTEYKSDHVILDTKSHEHDLKDFSFTFLELPKFNKNIDQLTNMIDKWAYFFKHAESSSQDEKKRLVGHDDILDKAYNELDRCGWTEKELLTYEESEKREKDYLASLEQKIDEGKKIGLVEGEQIGIVKGEQIGILKGEKLGIANEKINTARNMIKKKYELSDIAEITGLSLNQIKKMIKEGTK